MTKWLVETNEQIGKMATEFVHHARSAQPPFNISYDNSSPHSCGQFFKCNLSSSPVFPSAPLGDSIFGHGCPSCREEATGFITECNEPCPLLTYIGVF